MSRRPLSRRPLAAVAALTLGLAAAASTLLTPSGVRAATIAPDVQAWWSLANTGVAPPVAPPGVKADDLLVEGIEGTQKIAVPAPFPSGIGDRGGADAIAGLRFTIPPGAAVGKLTLQFDGSAPSSVSVLACRTTSAFSPAQDGRWSDLPGYDCSVPSAGKLSDDGKSLEFPQISALVKGSTLSFVIVPDAVDHEVLAKPGPGALALRESLPSFNLASPAAAPLPPPADVPLSSAGSFGFAPVPSVPIPAAAVPAPPAAAGPAATAAQPAPASKTPAVVAAIPAAGVTDDRRARIAAGLCLVAALAGFLLLAGADAPWLARLFGARRLPDAPAAAPRSRGVGRFARPRDGRPESL